MLVSIGKLHIMDQLQAPLPIHIILNGSNYILWAQEISSFLRGRWLWRYITGDIREPTKLIC